METMHVQPNIDHYNALLRIYLINEHRFEWQQVMDEIRSYRLEPDQKTYELIFEQLCRSEPMDEAKRFIDEIKSNGFQLTENLFCSMMLGYARVNDMASAVEIPNEMRRQGIEPTVQMTVSLMICYARRGEIDAIIDIIESPPIENSHAENWHILSVIVELCVNGNENKIESLVRHVKKSKRYHQLVHCTILKLIVLGKIEGAYTLLKTMPRATLASGELVEIGGFFLKQMMKSGSSSEAIITICRRMFADGMNSRSMYNALEHALRDGNVHLSFAVLKELQHQRETIRPHYFWPLLCSEGAKGKDHLFEIIRQMQSEFKLTPDAQTVVNFIFPHLKDSSPELITDKLRQMGLSSADIVQPILLHHLNQFDLNGACESATAHKSIYYEPTAILRKSLTTALVLSKDYASFARFVRIIRDSLPFGQESPDDQVNDKIAMEKMQMDLVGSLLYDAIANLWNYSSIDLVLRAFIGDNLLISAKQGQRIKTLLSKLDNHRNLVQYIDILTAQEQHDSSERSKKIQLNVKSNFQHRTRRITQLMNRIDREDIDGAISIWESLKSSDVLNERDMQHFVDFLKKSNRTKEIEKAVKQAATIEIRLSDEIWQDSLYELASAGNIAALDEFKQINCDRDTVPIDILNNACCTAYTLNDKAKEYMRHLEDQVNRANKATDLEHFPRNSAITILTKHPELLDACEYTSGLDVHHSVLIFRLFSFADKSLVNKYLNKNCTVPLNALWMYYFVIGNDEECRDLWTNTLSMVPKFSFDGILQVARTNHDAKLINRILSFFRSVEMDKENRIVAYNVLLNIHISNRALEEAKIAIEYSVWDDCYEHIDPNAILIVAKKMKAMGEKFPYKIPTSGS